MEATAYTKKERCESSEKRSQLAGDRAENSWECLSSLGTKLFRYSICIPSTCTPVCKLQKSRCCVSTFIAPYLTPVWDCVLLWVQLLPQRQLLAVVRAAPSGSSVFPPLVTQLTQPCLLPSRLLLGKALCLPSFHFISTLHKRRMLPSVHQTLIKLLFCVDYSSRH